MWQAPPLGLLRQLVPTASIFGFPTNPNAEPETAASHAVIFGEEKFRLFLRDFATLFEAASPHCAFRRKRTVKPIDCGRQSDASRTAVRRKPDSSPTMPDSASRRHWS
jgi:hypothetical protein